jgi:uncharacterized protein (TIGR01777 family)
MHIVIAGSSGFLGTALRAHLSGAGHSVITLVRRAPSGPSERRWAPDQGTVDTGLLAAADAVINLCGAGVQDKRWDDAYKRVLRTSRIEPTRTLATAIAGLPAADRPTLLSASAIGYYGDRGDEVLDENSAPGDGFLSDLCIAWEGANAAAREAGARVVTLRTGLPLDRQGGLLKALLLPFRLGIGGKLAGGRAYLPVISLADWLSGVSFLLERADITGPVNLMGPHPVRNAELTSVLGRLLHRPTLAPIPGLAIRILYGEVADDLLASDRGIPAVLTKAGFTFAHPDVESQLRAALA